MAAGIGRRGRRVAGLLWAAVLAVGLAGCGAVSGIETRARILSEPSCTDFFFPVYFARRSPDLSKAAQSVIAHAGRHAHGCMLVSVQVVGLEDYHAPPSEALALSHARAQNLDQVLRAAGLTGAVFQRSALGESAAPPSPRGPEPRRADVFVRFQH